MRTNPLLIVNPDSGRYSGRRIEYVIAELSRLGLTPRTVSVRTPKEAAHYLCVAGQQSGHPNIIVAAGDGTFNTVLNCVEPGTATLAVLPLGTSNVLAAELGIVSLDDGIQRIARGETRLLKVGQIQMGDARYYFGLMAGIGFDGAVVRDVGPFGKRLLKQGAFALSAFRNCLGWDRRCIEIVSPAGTFTCHTAVVCNVSRYGGDFMLAPDQTPFLPGFTLACVMGGERRTYLRLARDIFQGSVAANGDLLRLPATELEIRGAKPVQIDGDFVGYGPAKITTVPEFARIIV